MRSFAELVPPTRTGPSRFSVDVPDGWQQGRGSFGGLVIALLQRALETEIAEAIGHMPKLRSLTAEIPAPVVVGPATVIVDVLRAGTGMTTAMARLEQAGVVCAHAVGVFGKARTDGPRWQTQTPPTVKHWSEYAVLPQSPQLSPAFSQHVEFRVVTPMPFSRAAEASLLGWVRLRNPGPARDAAYVIALADAYWPTAFSVMATPRPSATVAFTLEMIESLDGRADDDPVDEPDAPLLVRALSPAARDGYVFETRELWTTEGRLVARNHQTFVIIK